MRTGFILTLLFGFLNLIVIQGCDTSPTTPSDSPPDTLSMSDIADSSLMNLGIGITDNASKVLSGHLEKAMKEGGVPNALGYCNVNAIPMTDSLSELHGVTLRRTAFRTRNEKNAPSDWDENILINYEKIIQSDGIGKFAPVLRRDKPGEVTFYRPIYALGKCMACHGTPGKELDLDHYKQIQSLYPKDQATHFKPGDLRGMWVVEFVDPVAVSKMLKDSLR